VNKSRNSFTLKFLLIVFLAAFVSASMPAQEKSLGDDRDRGKEMLSKIKDDLKRYYYDPKLRGIDVDARFKEAAAKIDEALARTDHGNHRDGTGRVKRFAHVFHTAAFRP